DGRRKLVGRTPAPAPLLAPELRAALPAPRRRTSRTEHPAPLRDTRQVLRGAFSNGPLPVGYRRWSRRCPGAPRHALYSAQMCVTYGDDRRQSPNEMCLFRRPQRRANVICRTDPTFDRVEGFESFTGVEHNRLGVRVEPAGGDQLLEHRDGHPAGG